MNHFELYHLQELVIKHGAKALDCIELLQGLNGLDITQNELFLLSTYVTRGYLNPDAVTCPYNLSLQTLKMCYINFLRLGGTTKEFLNFVKELYEVELIDKHIYWNLV